MSATIQSTSMRTSTTGAYSARRRSRGDGPSRRQYQRHARQVVATSAREMPTRLPMIGRGRITVWKMSTMTLAAMRRPTRAMTTFTAGKRTPPGRGAAEGRNSGGRAGSGAGLELVPDEAAAVELRVHVEVVARWRRDDVRRERRVDGGIRHRDGRRRAPGR